MIREALMSLIVGVILAFTLAGAASSIIWQYCWSVEWVCLNPSTCSELATIPNPHWLCVFLVLITFKILLIVLYLGVSHVKEVAQETYKLQRMLCDFIWWLSAHWSSAPIVLHHSKVLRL